MSDGTRLTRAAYSKIIEDDVQWLGRQPSAPEREHIEIVLRASVRLLYPPHTDDTGRQWTLCTVHNTVIPAGVCRACGGDANLVQVRVARSPTAEDIRAAVREGSPADIVFRVEPNDDPLITCFICLGRDDAPCHLSTTFYTPRGRVTCGLHQDCYDRARTPVPRHSEESP